MFPRHLLSVLAVMKNYPESLLKIQIPKLHSRRSLITWCTVGWESLSFSVPWLEITKVMLTKLEIWPHLWTFNGKFQNEVHPFNLTTPTQYIKSMNAQHQKMLMTPPQWTKLELMWPDIMGIFYSFLGSLCFTFDFIIEIVWLHL